jgi:glycosyltransferase involved in cell wall biosynthesis
MLVHAYYPLAEPRVQREAAAALAARFDVTVLALRGKGEPREETVDGVRVRRLSVSHVRGGGFGRMLYEYVWFCVLAGWWLGRRAWRRPFDIIHVHNPPDFLVLAALLPRILGARLILDIHDLSSHIFESRVRGLAGALVGRLLVWMEVGASALANSVITVHEQYRGELAVRGVPASKVTVVMNSLDEHLLTRARQSDSVAPPVERFRIAYHGTLTWWYGTDLIIEALALLREEGIDAEALILGEGDALPALRKQIAAAALNGYVHVPGRYVPIEVALASVSGAACGVIPNRPSTINRFALSSKLFEYVALGIPVVAARLETLAAHFDEREVTYFEPGNPTAVAAAVRWVYEHPEEALAKASRAQIRAQGYSWAVGRERLIGVYRAVAPVTTVRAAQT